MKVLVFLLAFVALSVSAIPLEVSNASNTYGDEEQVAAFNKYVREALENVRAQMKDGIPDIKMPPLEPLHMKDEKVQVNQVFVNLDIILHEVSVSGLSSFQVLDLWPDFPKLSFKAGFRFPKVSISGSYEAKGKLMKVIPVHGNGRYNVTLLGVKGGGATKVIWGEEDLEIRAPEIYVKWDKLKLDLGNFMGGGRFGHVIQRFLHPLFKSLFEESKFKVLERISEELRIVANKNLNSDRVRDVVEKVILGLTE